MEYYILVCRIAGGNVELLRVFKELSEAQLYMFTYKKHSKDTLFVKRNTHL